VDPVAMATGADIVGIDISSTALKAARERATSLGLDGRARFEVLAYEETDDWRRRISDTTAGLLENAAELATESGQDVETTTG
jgi:cyclopropane fatty-acyl-phospholipid synthase-like methyltransferase